ncbi:hypothetical protein VTL71DRAFT_8618 [Oculimacula yallundae]|uniref:CCHC-type domain-containing protein n=1 Tax=Oculimacula yallundae TaxID=86028 RepID=A0ABR4D0H9_9HELO
MASSNVGSLCNGVPVDHRLKKYLSNAKQKHSHGVGKHADIIETFGNTMIRDNGTTPSNHESSFASWLAKPDMTGGLVIALQQPTKSQVFTTDMEWVQGECETLTYLDKSLAFLNGPGGLKTTSVFDAFPFITEKISSKELSSEAKLAYNTFLSMVEAKKPEVLFACWRIHGQDGLSCSGIGLEKGQDGEQLNTEPGRELRRTRADNTAKKYKAYTKSFDNGLKSLKQIFDHMVSSAYTSQSSWDLYQFFVFDQNTSESICDALLAVSEAMKQFSPGSLMSDSALIELGKHISQQTLEFLKDDIPDLVQYQRGLCKDLWSSRYLASTSRGLKQSIEKITARFFEDLIKSFSESSTGWTYIPELVHDAFKELAISFEDALGRAYDDQQNTVRASATNDVAILSTSLRTLSILSSQPEATAMPGTNMGPIFSSSSYDCFNCGEPGHWSSKCPRPKKGSVTPSRSSPQTSCYSCGKPGHWSSSCASTQKSSVAPSTPSRPSTSSVNGNCYSCGQPGHWSTDYSKQQMLRMWADRALVE